MLSVPTLFLGCDHHPIDREKIALVTLTLDIDILQPVTVPLSKLNDKT